MNLQESINEVGLRVPIIVVRMKHGYKLIDGKNRLGCVSDMAEVPCIIVGEEGTHYLPKCQIRQPK